MKHLNQKSFFVFSAVAAIALCMITKPAASQTSGSVRLAYSYPADKPVKYISTSKILQDMDINGQIISVNVAAILGCSVKGLGKDNNDLVLEIKIDTLAQTIDSPGGLMGGEMKETVGKVFTMKILPSGKETDLSGAEKITFTNYEGVSNTLKESFTEFFPDLPAEALAPGYTWPSTDTISNKTATTDLFMIIHSENKFEGYEKLNGINCARISYTLSGSRDVKTQNQGMDIKMKGPMTGTGELFFAPDKGYFLKQVIKIRMTGQVEITSPEVMSFPVTLDQSSVTETKD